jgi:hypothetical protein
MGKGSPKTALDWEIYRASGIPGPSEYNLLRFGDRINAEDNGPPPASRWEERLKRLRSTMHAHPSLSNGDGLLELLVSDEVTLGPTGRRLQERANAKKHKKMRKALSKHESGRQELTKALIEGDAAFFKHVKGVGELTQLALEQKYMARLHAEEGATRRDFQVLASTEDVWEARGGKKVTDAVRFIQGVLVKERLQVGEAVRIHLGGDNGLLSVEGTVVSEGGRESERGKAIATAINRGGHGRRGGDHGRRAAGGKLVERSRGGGGMKEASYVIQFVDGLTANYAEPPMQRKFERLLVHEGALHRLICSGEKNRFDDVAVLGVHRMRVVPSERQQASSYIRHSTVMVSSASAACSWGAGSRSRESWKDNEDDFGDDSRQDTYRVDFVHPAPAAPEGYALLGVEADIRIQAHSAQQDQDSDSNKGVGPRACFVLKKTSHAVPRSQLITRPVLLIGPAVCGGAFGKQYLRTMAEPGLGTTAKGGHKSDGWAGGEVRAGDRDERGLHDKKPQSQRLVPLYVPVAELVASMDAKRYPIAPTVAGVASSTGGVASSTGTAVASSTGTAADAASILAKHSEERLAASTIGSIDTDGDADLLRIFLEAKYAGENEDPDTLGFLLAARTEKRLVVMLDGLSEVRLEYRDMLLQYVTGRLVSEVHLCTTSSSHIDLGPGDGGFFIRAEVEDRTAKHQLVAVNMAICAALHALEVANRALAVALPLEWAMRCARVVQAFKQEVVGSFIKQQGQLASPTKRMAPMSTKMAPALQDRGQGAASTAAAQSVIDTAATVGKACESFHNLTRHKQQREEDHAPQELALVSVPGSAYRWHSRSRFVKLNSRRRKKQGQIVAIEIDENGVDKLPVAFENGQTYMVKFDGLSSLDSVDGRDLLFAGPSESEWWREAIGEDGGNGRYGSNRSGLRCYFSCVRGNHSNTVQADAAGDGAHVDREVQCVSSQRGCGTNPDNCANCRCVADAGWVCKRLQEVYAHVARLNGNDDGAAAAAAAAALRSGSSAAQSSSSPTCGTGCEHGGCAWFDPWATNVLNASAAGHDLRFSYIDIALHKGQPEFICTAKGYEGKYYVGPEQLVELEWAQNRIGLVMRPLHPMDLTAAEMARKACSEAERMCRLCRPAELEIGDEIKANWLGQDKWYNGKVVDRKRVKSAGRGGFGGSYGGSLVSRSKDWSKTYVYDIKYEDGSFEQAKRADEIQLGIDAGLKPPELLELTSGRDWAFAQWVPSVFLSASSSSSSSFGACAGVRMVEAETALKVEEARTLHAEADRIVSKRLNTAQDAIRLLGARLGLATKAKRQELQGSADRITARLSILVQQASVALQAVDGIGDAEGGQAQAMAAGVGDQVESKEPELEPEPGSELEPEAVERSISFLRSVEHRLEQSTLLVSELCEQELLLQPASTPAANAASAHKSGGSSSVIMMLRAKAAMIHRTTGQRFAQRIESLQARLTLQLRLWMGAKAFVEDMHRWCDGPVATVNVHEVSSTLEKHQRLLEGVAEDAQAQLHDSWGGEENAQHELQLQQQEQEQERKRKEEAKEGPERRSWHQKKQPSIRAIKINEMRQMSGIQDLPNKSLRLRTEIETRSRVFQQAEEELPLLRLLTNPRLQLREHWQSVKSLLHVKSGGRPGRLVSFSKLTSQIRPILGFIREEMDAEAAAERKAGFNAEQKQSQQSWQIALSNTANKPKAPKNANSPSKRHNQGWSPTHHQRIWAEGTHAELCRLEQHVNAGEDEKQAAILLLVNEAVAAVHAIPDYQPRAAGGESRVGNGVPEQAHREVLELKRALRSAKKLAENAAALISAVDPKSLQELRRAPPPPPGLFGSNDDGDTDTDGGGEQAGEQKAVGPPGVVRLVFDCVRLLQRQPMQQVTRYSRETSRWVTLKPEQRVHAWANLPQAEQEQHQAASKIQARMRGRVVRKSAGARVRSSPSKGRKTKGGGNAKRGGKVKSKKPDSPRKGKRKQPKRPPSLQTESPKLMAGPSPLPQVQEDTALTTAAKGSKRGKVRKVGKVEFLVDSFGLEQASAAASSSHDHGTGAYLKQLAAFVADWPQDEMEGATHSRNKHCPQKNCGVRGARGVNIAEITNGKDTVNAETMEFLEPYLALGPLGFTPANVAVAERSTRKHQQGSRNLGTRSRRSMAGGGHDDAYADCASALLLRWVQSVLVYSNYSTKQRLGERRTVLQRADERLLAAEALCARAEVEAAEAADTAEATNVGSFRTADEAGDAVVGTSSPLNEHLRHLQQARREYKVRVMAWEAAWRNTTA